MHGISINSSLEIDLLSLRKYNVRRPQGQGQGQGLFIIIFEFTKKLIKTKDYMKEKFTTYLYILEVLSSSSPISLKS